jgi:hypothetical protein
MLDTTALVARSEEQGTLSLLRIYSGQSPFHERNTAQPDLSSNLVEVEVAIEVETVGPTHAIDEQHAAAANVSNLTNVISCIFEIDLAAKGAISSV